MLRIAILVALFLIPVGFVNAQTLVKHTDGTTFMISEVESSDSFHREIIRAASKLRVKGELSRAKMIRLRVAMLSPAFRQRAKELAVTQMAFSNSDAPIPVNSQGEIDETAIDWDSLADFLERLIPIIVQLMSIFGAL